LFDDRPLFDDKHDVTQPETSRRFGPATRRTERAAPIIVAYFGPLASGIPARDMMFKR